jgi:hypothetical protein
MILSQLASAKNSFYILNRDGILIQIDPASAFETKYPKKPGPTEAPKDISADEFENKLLPSITDDADKKILTDSYSKVEAEKKYILNKDKDNKKDLLVIRNILMKYNKDNEMYTGLDQHGAASPHNFPRVFEAKTKANFDFYFVWGVKFDNFYVNNTKLGNLDLGFALNLTNFVMPSLEFSLKYNFYLYGYPFEPFVGASLIGGFIDGFPIQLNVLGGADIFPMNNENIPENRNLFVNAEMRLGAALYAATYFDTGLNTEPIWKKLSWLIQGGFYTGVGYVWAN